MSDTTTPEVKLEIETTIIQAQERKLEGDWTCDIMHGWPLLLAPEDLPDDYVDDRTAAFAALRPVGKDDLKEGLRVVWKGVIFDYLWILGVIKKWEWDGTKFYVENLNGKWFGSVDFCERRQCWTNLGACMHPPASLFTR